MVGAGGAEGAIDASNIFKPALARGNIRIIGATTLNEYKKYIEPDAALSRRFQSVIIEEPKTSDVINILKKIKPLYEKFHNISISNKLIDDIVNLSSMYLTNRFEPDRSIDILDEVCAKVSIFETKEDKKRKSLLKRKSMILTKKNKALIDNDFKTAYELKKEENKVEEELSKIKIFKKTVSKKDIIEVIKAKGNLNDFMEETNRASFYEELKNKLKSIIYGQDDNIDKLINSLRRKDILKKKSCHSVMITGNKGTGKTFLAENYAKNIVNEKNIIRIDAQEYYDHHMISKLIGTTAGYLGYDNKNNIFEKLKDNPNSVLIIDNYEDGCEEFKNIFNRILESGYIEDASGVKIDFTNSTIVFIFDCIENESKLGFNKLSTKDNNDKLIKNISVVLEMKPINKDLSKKIIKDNIKSVMKKYPQVFIDYDKKIEDIIYNKIKDNNLSDLSNLIEKYFEIEILDAITLNKTKIYIKAKEESIV